MAREKAFKTPTGLKKAINKYFDSISRFEHVTEKVPTGELDSYGHPVFEEREVISAEGKPIEYRRFFIPPRLGRMYMALEISETTFRRYASGEVGRDEEEKREFQRVCEYARAVCEDWLRQEKLTRTKGLAGVMHELERHYGDGVEKKVIVESAAPMTLDEKTALLEDLGILTGDSDEREG